VLTDLRTLVRPSPRADAAPRLASAGLTLSALGVVFGDADPVGYFRPPDRRAVTMGWEVPL
jgi:hypothetical protein